MIKYVLRRQGGPWSAPKTFYEMRADLKEKLTKVGGPFRIMWPDSNEWGPPKTRDQVIKTISTRIPKSGVGDIWRIDTKNGEGDSFAIKVILVGLPERQPVFDISDGGASIQKIARISAGYDAGVRTAGIAYTRKIAGTNIWSQHSRWPRLGCKGNAIDLYFPLPYPIGNDISRQRRLVSYLLNNVDEIPIGQIISEKTYWSRDNDWKPSYYSGIPHVGHTHIEAYPKQTGSPC